MQHVIPVTRAHVFRGDPFEPEEHPVALAFKEVFPEYTPHVLYDTYCGWYAEVGGYGWVLEGAVWNLCHTLTDHGIDYRLWDVWSPDETTYKAWVWAAYKTENLVIRTPPLGDPAWREECPFCREIHYQCFMTDLPGSLSSRICAFCLDREPELAQ